METDPKLALLTIRIVGDALRLKAKLATQIDQIRVLYKPELPRKPNEAFEYPAPEWNEVNEAYSNYLDNLTNAWFLSVERLFPRVSKANYLSIRDILETIFLQEQARANDQFMTRFGPAYDYSVLAKRARTEFGRRMELLDPKMNTRIGQNDLGKINNAGKNDYPFERLSIGKWKYLGKPFTVKPQAEDALIKCVEKWKENQRKPIEIHGSEFLEPEVFFGRLFKPGHLLRQNKVIVINKKSKGWITFSPAPHKIPQKSR